MSHTEINPTNTVPSMEQKKNHLFDPDKFVDFILEEGPKNPCDSTVSSFNHTALPKFYNEDLYRRGQKFFHDNIFALFFTKLLGLMTGLAIPSSRTILMHTNMSSTPITAYKRYMTTINHMCIWYQSDFTPGSKLWKSLMTVKNLHSSASKKCGANGIQTICQRDMAIAQFSFMGFAVIWREKIGISNANNDDWRAFIHIWRVVGSVLGVEERFNICRDSVEETTAICRRLIDKIVGPMVHRRDKDFIFMAANLLEGMWVMNPMLNTNVFLVFLHNFTQTDVPSDNGPYLQLSIKDKIQYRFVHFGIWSLQFSIFKVFYNFVQVWTLWIMKVFPFLAYYKYGYSDSHVVFPLRSSK